ncbi:hypothetical protein [Microbacterium sp.]|uniref:hypothetical protein n=1 Tax=Microbacterium sp. TaxID=51671 RepID=UPI0026252967|nr:hypothetical protein [Microbacterium sp.]
MTAYGAPDGHGRYGMLEADDGKLRCHECGEWRAHLATHARLAHDITAAEYRERHGLGATTRLVGTAVREKMRVAYDRNRDLHLAVLEQHRDPGLAAANSRSHTKSAPWAPEVRAKRQAVGRARRSPDLTPEQARRLGDGIDLQQWADAARELLAEGATIAAIARASGGIMGTTVAQRLRRYPPRP